MFRTEVFFSILCALAGALPALAEDTAPEVSLEGLELVDKSRRGEIYEDPNVDWSVYTQVHLDPATVAFRKNWQRDQNRMQPFKVEVGPPPTKGYSRSPTVSVLAPNPQSTGDGI